MLGVEKQANFYLAKKEVHFKHVSISHIATAAISSFQKHLLKSFLFFFAVVVKEDKTSFQFTRILLLGFHLTFPYQSETALA